MSKLKDGARDRAANQTATQAAAPHPAAPLDEIDAEVDRMIGECSPVGAEGQETVPDGRGPDGGPEPCEEKPPRPAPKRVLVEVPFTTPWDGYIGSSGPQYIQLSLRPEESLVFRSLWQGLRDQSPAATLASGKLVDSATDALRWLLETLGESMREAGE